MKLNWAAWAFVAPALLVIAVFFLLPSAGGACPELHRLRHLRHRRFGVMRWVGPANYPLVQARASGRRSKYGVLCARRRAALDGGSLGAALLSMRGSRGFKRSFARSSLPRS